MKAGRLKKKGEGRRGEGERRGRKISGLPRKKRGKARRGSTGRGGEGRGPGVLWEAWQQSYHGAHLDTTTAPLHLPDPSTWRPSTRSLVRKSPVRRLIWRAAPCHTSPHLSKLTHLGTFWSVTDLSRCSRFAVFESF